MFTVKNLAQGKHTMVITASDKGGNVVTDKQTFVVDSTEHFGTPRCGRAPAARTSRSCRSSSPTSGVFTAAKTGVYDDKTVKAVKKFQAKYGMTVDGLVGGMVLTALSGQIIVDIGDLHLYLYRDGKLVKSYPVATGQPAYPTPTGDLRRSST